METQTSGCRRSKKLKDSLERIKIWVAGTPALITCKPGHSLPSSGNVTLEREHSLLKDSQESEREGGDL